MKRSGLDRKEIFLETKLWPSFYEQSDAVEKTLDRLDTDYIDLLLIHQPAGNYIAGYQLMEKAYKAGKVKAIEDKRPDKKSPNRGKKHAAEKTEETPALAPGALLARVVYRSKRVDPELEAKKVEITAGKRVRQSKWNRYLRKFEYKKALNAVLEVGINRGFGGRGET